MFEFNRPAGNKKGCAEGLTGRPSGASAASGTPASGSRLSAAYLNYRRGTLWWPSDQDTIQRPEFILVLELSSSEREP